MVKERIYDGNRDISRWVALGKFCYCEVIITKYVEGFPNIDTLKFESEDEYNWFLMRWS